MEEPVTIVDRDVLKALSADTRMDILKVLADGGRMPSFIGKKLNKTDATIVEHLRALENAGLVKKVEQPGKKFVFYTLTERGIGIVSSKTKRLVVILSTSALTLAAGAFTGLMSIMTPRPGFQSMQQTAASLPSEAAKTISGQIPPAAPLPVAFDFLSLASIALLSLSLITFVIYLVEKRKAGASK